MPTLISRAIVAQVSDALNTDSGTGGAIMASLKQEGLHGAMRRFPAYRASIVRQANIWRNRANINPRELYENQFSGSYGLDWVISIPVNLDTLKAVIHDRDMLRSHIRFSATLTDVATGSGTGTHLNGNLASQYAVCDPVLRMNICRAIGPIIKAKLVQYIQEQTSMSYNIKKFAVSTGQYLTQIDLMVRHTTFKARRIPHLEGLDAHRISMDVGFTVTFELSVDMRGGVLPSVDIVTDGTMFEVSAGVNTLMDGADKLTPGRDKTALKKFAGRIEAISTQNRRRFHNAVIDKGPEEGIHSETLVEENGERAIIGVVLPPTSAPAIQAAVGSGSEAAAEWWVEHKGLIQPTLGEISSMAISAYGDKAGRDTIDALIDLSLPTLYTVAQKRQTQFEMGLDAAVMGLAKLLRNEFIARLR